MFAHEFLFDPTYGYDDAALLRVPAPVGPADFAEFWRATFGQAMAVTLNLSMRRIESPRADTELYEVEYDSLDGVRIGGWLTRPADGVVQRGVVVGHGYGGREAPDFNLPGPPAATLQFCARGFHRSARADLPDLAARHVTHGIDDRRRYIIRGCVADVWLAASALLAWMPQTAGNLHYHGRSFGGGLGALALPWDCRFARAYLHVPTFGNQPLRVTLTCNGSGHWVTRYWREHPQVLDEVLAYYDAATAARHIHIPVLVSVARFDPAVPPPGQCAVYNGLPGPRQLVWFEAGHFGYPNEAKDNEQLNAALCRFFS
ncbi:MAG: acetylxylan esterase [Phycisphaeraceae bacterium]